MIIYCTFKGASRLDACHHAMLPIIEPAIAKGNLWWRFPSSILHCLCIQFHSAWFYWSIPDSIFQYFLSSTRWYYNYVVTISFFRFDIICCVHVVSSGFWSLLLPPRGVPGSSEILGLIVVKVSLVPPVPRPRLPRGRLNRGHGDRRASRRPLFG